jgi:hypothetical protein
VHNRLCGQPDLCKHQSEDKHQVQRRSASAVLYLMGVCGSKDGADSHTPAKRSGMGAKELVQTTIDQNKVCSLFAAWPSLKTLVRL